MCSWLQGTVTQRENVSGVCIRMVRNASHKIVKSWVHFIHAKCDHVWLGLRVCVKNMTLFGRPVVRYEKASSLKEGVCFWDPFSTCYLFWHYVSASFVRNIRSSPPTQFANITNNGKGTLSAGKDLTLERDYVHLTYICLNSTSFIFI